MFDRDKPVNGTKIDADLLRGNMNDLDDRDAATNQRIDNLPPPEPGPKGDKGDPGESIVGPPGIQGPAGSDGQPGANGADGRSINPAGEYNPMQTYNRCDLVPFNGALYTCLTDGTTGIQPDTDSMRWMLSIPASSGGSAFPHNGIAIIRGDVHSEGGSYHITGSDPGGSGENSLRLARTDSGTGSLLNLATKVNGTEVANTTFDPAGIRDGGGIPSVQNGDIYRYDGTSQSQKPTRDDTARNPATVDLLTITSGDPVLQALIDKINEHITATKR